MLNFDMCKRQYLSMVESFENFHFEWIGESFGIKNNMSIDSVVPVIEEEWLNMENFKTSLVRISDDLADSTKALAHDLLGVLTTVIDKKDDVVNFI